MDQYERVLLVKSEVFMFRIPPLGVSKGHKFVLKQLNRCKRCDLEPPSGIWSSRIGMDVWSWSASETSWNCAWKIRTQVLVVFKSRVKIFVSFCNIPMICYCFKVNSTPKHQSLSQTASISSRWSILRVILLSDSATTTVKLLLSELVLAIEVTLLIWMLQSRTISSRWKETAKCRQTKKVHPNWTWDLKAARQLLLNCQAPPINR